MLFVIMQKKSVRMLKQKHQTTFKLIAAGSDFDRNIISLFESDSANGCEANCKRRENGKNVDCACPFFCVSVYVLGFWNAPYFLRCQAEIASGALLNVNINPYPIHSFASSDQMERNVCGCGYGLFQIKFTHHLHSHSLARSLSLRCMHYKSDGQTFAC